VIGQGTLKLYNQDGELDDIFDRYFFENQRVLIYSWNKDLRFSESQIIYRGRVTNKSFNLNEITFTVKDPLFDLQQPVPTGVYTEEETDDTTLQGRSKRWVYGRVDGLEGAHIDRIGAGFNIQGTAAMEGDSDILIGTGTQFLRETSPGDMITVNDQNFGIESVVSDTELRLRSEARNSFGASEIFIRPDVPPPFRNRTFELTSHAISETAAVITEVIQLNRLRVDDNSRFFVGDLIQIGSTGENIELRSVGQDGLLVLQQSAVNVPVVGDTINRVAVQSIFIDGEEVLEDDFTVINNVDGCTVVIDEDAEQNIAEILRTNVQARFINGSRSIQIMGETDNIEDALQARSLVRSSAITSTTFHDVLGLEDVDSTEIDFEDHLNANFPTIIVNSFDFLPLPGEVGRTYQVLNLNTLYSFDGSAYQVVSDIYQPPATNYNTNSRLYVKDVDRFKYDAGMTITIDLDDIGEWVTDITAVSRVLGDSYIEIASALPRPATNQDTIQELEVLRVREVITEPTSNGTIEYRVPNYIADNTSVSFNVYGKTKDGTVTGDLIRTGAEAVLDMIKAIGIVDINLPQFEKASTDANQLLSLSIPQTPGRQTQNVREAVDLINRSVIGSLNMDNNLDLQYVIIEPQIDERLIPEVMDSHVIDWKVITINGDIISDIGVNYRHQDYKLADEGLGSENIEHNYEFVNKYIGTTARDDINVYFYHTFDAEIRAHREAYYNSLSRSDITFESDLRLENLAIGDSVVVNFRRLYRRLGDNFDKKVVMVVGKKVTGTRITYTCTDYGNIYNRSNIITRDDAPCYEDATDDEKLRLGFITDNRGIVDDDEDTNNVHLIN